MKNTEVENEVKGNEVAERVDDMLVLSPKTDIFENNNEINILIEMPGVEQSGVDISFENNVISFSGKPIFPTISEEYDILREEIPYARYERSFSILSDIDVNKISAKIKDGILNVILPKSEKVKPRKIEVKVE